MADTVRLLLLLLSMSHVQADYPCVCIYDGNYPVYQQPILNTTIITTLKKSECKPVFQDYNGTPFIAIHIAGKIGYINAASRFEQRICKGNASVDIEPRPQVPVTWPRGTYGLMKPRTGCPDGHVSWREGYRVQDSLSQNTDHHFSGDISNTLSGNFRDKIETHYCIKTDPTTSQYDRDWPQGNYCILKKGNCPVGFSSGSIYWDDADFFNKNDVGGTLPDGSYGSNTRIYYCCRSDGPTSNPITLPVDRSFVLLRYTGACQSVYNMNVREVFIQWDTADFFNYDEDKGAHPLDDGGDEHKLHFCFYSFNTGGVIVG